MKRPMKDVTVIALGIIALIYLSKPTAGFLELIPDTLPVIGNLDEAGAVLIIVSALRYYGIDLSTLFNRDKRVEDETIVVDEQEPTV